MSQKSQINIKNLEAKRKVTQLIILLKNHESKFVMERAIRALGIIKDPHAIAPLINAFEDSEIVSHAAVWALNQIGTPAVESLIAALKESSKKGKHAAETLGKIKDLSAIKPLIDCFSASNKVSKAAIWALAEIGEPAVEPLIDALFEFKKLRYAAETLGKIGDSRAIEPLIHAFKKNLYPKELRTIIARALEKLAWNPPKNRLGAQYNILLGDWDKVVDIGAPAINPIIFYLETLDNLNGSLATKALGDINDPNAVNHLILHLFHESHFVRVNIIRALGNIGNLRAVEQLINMLDDEYSRQDVIYGNKWDEDSEMINYSVRNAVVAALRRIAGGRFLSKDFTNDYIQEYWDEEKKFWQQWWETKKELRKEEEIYDL